MLRSAISIFIYSFFAILSFGKAHHSYNKSFGASNFSKIIGGFLEKESRCDEGYFHSIPPFYISKTYKQFSKRFGNYYNELLLYENLRSVETNRRTQYLPVNSLIKIEKGIKAKKDQKVIYVLGTTSDVTEKEIMGQSRPDDHIGLKSPRFKHLMHGAGIYNKITSKGLKGWGDRQCKVHEKKCTKTYIESKCDIGYTEEQVKELDKRQRRKVKKKLRSCRQIQKKCDAFPMYCEKFTRAKRGSTGAINKNSIRNIQKNESFILSENGPMIFTDNGFLYNDYKLKFAINDKGEFRTFSCCKDARISVSPECSYRYELQLIDGNQNIVAREFLTTEKIHKMAEHMRVVEDNFVDEILATIAITRKYYSERGDTDSPIFFGIDSLNYIPRQPGMRKNSRKGIRKTVIERPPLVKVPIDLETKFGLYRSYHYKSDDYASSDGYSTPLLTCLLPALKRRFEQICPPSMNPECTSDPDCDPYEGCDIQWGDIYHDTRLGAHRSHDSGRCFDVRPFRKKDDEDLGLTWRSRRYSRDRTKAFIKLLKYIGADLIIFNDPYIRGVRRDRTSTHDNHLHVCFEKNESTKAICNWEKNWALDSIYHRDELDLEPRVEENLDF